MNYQKAIEKLQYIKRGYIPDWGNKRDEYYPMHEAITTAISAMQELQMYKDSKLCLIPENVFKVQCEELDEYKQIGTLEEVRDAVEKQKPKHPIISPWSPAICPTCGEELSEHIGDGYYRHRTFLERCPNIECAQRLDWSRR